MDKNSDSPRSNSGLRQIGSAITGLGSPGPGASSSTGTQLSATGYAPTLSVNAPAPQTPANLRDALAASLPMPLRSLLTSKWNSDFTEITGWVWLADPAGPTTKTYQNQGLQVLTTLERKMHPTELTALITALSLATKSRQEADEDQQGRIKLFLGLLAEYPAHDIRYAVKKIIRTGTFFPAWAELEKHLEDARMERERLANAISYPEIESKPAIAEIPHAARQQRTMSYIESLGRAKSSQDDRG